jgi:hypothetical protein
VASLEPDGAGVRLESGERLAAEADVLAGGAAEAARLLPDPGPAESAANEQLRASPTLVLAVATRAHLGLPARVVFVPSREGGELAGVIDATPDGATRRASCGGRAAGPVRATNRSRCGLAHFLSSRRPG